MSRKQRVRVVLGVLALALVGWLLWWQARGRGAAKAGGLSALTAYQQTVLEEEMNARAAKWGAAVVRAERASGLRTMLSRCLRDDVAREVFAGPGLSVNENSSWRLKPVEVRAAISSGVLRARSEAGFVVLWLHSRTASFGAADDPVATLTRASAAIFDRAYTVERQMIVPPGTPGSGRKWAQMYDEPQRIPDTDIVWCAYGYPDGKDQWTFVALDLSILVKGPDVVVAMVHFSPQPSDSVHEGLDAAKGKLAASAIAGIEKVAGIPKPLLNACMWPAGKQERTAIEIGEYRKPVSLAPPE